MTADDRPRARLRVAAALVAAAALLAGACSTDTPPETAAPEAPPATEAAAAQPPPTTEAASAPTTAAPTTTTAEAVPGPAAQIRVRSGPRLYDGVLWASWDVTPDDTACAFDLIDADGAFVGSGVAEFGDSITSRQMRVEVDEVTAGTLSEMGIRCDRRDTETARAQLAVHRVEYQNRHPDSVIPADDDHYFDHTEIAALFGECNPRPRTVRRPNVFEGVYDHIAGKISDVDGDGRITLNDWLDESFDFWQHEVFENWDTELHEAYGQQIAAGWWTTRQLRMRYPDGDLTPELARENAFPYPDAVAVEIEAPNGKGWVNPDYSFYPYHYGGTTYELESLYLRLADAVDYEATEDRVPSIGKLAELIRDDGIAGDGPNPRGVNAGELLWDWTDARYESAPVDREPTAWAMRTLLEARSYACVASTMRAHCESGEFHPSPHMRHPSQGGSRLGSVLWSAVCPEIAPDAQ